MSYARFGWDNSSVYVFPSGDGLECCGCSLISPIGRFCTRSIDAMAAHLDAHRAAGHTVPTSVMPEIRADEQLLINERIVDAPGGGS